jgi:hypothetical protein
MDLIGAESRTRTGTRLLAPDFESGVSTSFTTSAKVGSNIKRLIIESRHRPTLPPGSPAVPWLRGGFTSVFGMGTGVSPLPRAPALENGSLDENNKPEYRVEDFFRVVVVSQTTRSISIGRLHMLPCFHLRPIKQVVYL